MISLLIYYVQYNVNSHDIFVLFRDPTTIRPNVTKSMATSAQPMVKLCTTCLASGMRLSFVDMLLQLNVFGDQVSNYDFYLAQIYKTKGHKSIWIWEMHWVSYCRIVTSNCSRAMFFVLRQENSHNLIKLSWK